jgi:hypothetical protein
LLVLEPTAQIFSSAGVNPGVPEIGRFPVGEFEVESYVSQEAVFDGYDSTAPGSYITRRVYSVAVLDTASVID